MNNLARVRPCLNLTSVRRAMCGLTVTVQWNMLPLLQPADVAFGVLPAPAVAVVHRAAGVVPIEIVAAMPVAPAAAARVVSPVQQLHPPPAAQLWPGRTQRLISSLSVSATAQLDVRLVLQLVDDSALAAATALQVRGAMTAYVYCEWDARMSECACVHPFRFNAPRTAATIAQEQGLSAVDKLRATGLRIPASTNVTQVRHSVRVRSAQNGRPHPRFTVCHLLVRRWFAVE